MATQVSASVGGKHQRGLTLIELMTVVIVVAVLGSIAVSSYRSYLLRTNRTEARMALLRVQAAQEKFFLQNHRYAENGELLSGLGIPTTTPNGLYTLSIPAANATTYRAQAVATGGQAQDAAACRTLSIDQNGNRTPTNPECWR